MTNVKNFRLGLRAENHALHKLPLIPKIQAHMTHTVAVGVQRLRVPLGRVCSNDDERKTRVENQKREKMKGHSVDTSNYSNDSTGNVEIVWNVLNAIVIVFQVVACGDSLDERKERDLFLVILCFKKGRQVDHVVRRWISRRTPPRRPDGPLADTGR